MSDQIYLPRQSTATLVAGPKANLQKDKLASRSYYSFSNDLDPIPTEKLEIVRPRKCN